MPEDPEYRVPEEQKNNIMHISLPIGGDTVLMGSDTGGEWGPETIIGNNFSLSVTADTKEDADAMHKKLSEGGPGDYAHGRHILG